MGRILIRTLYVAISYFVLTGCAIDNAEPQHELSGGIEEQPKTTIAFLADIHLHDVVASAKKLDTSDLPRLANGSPVLIRSMQAQLHSTRLFNENYFVLRAILDELANKGIELVALPGDFSDDGQPANIEALANLLDEYHTRYGMRFFAINGNHDPVRPFTRPGGKVDFLDKHGKEVVVASNDHPKCISNTAWQCSDAFREWGYREIARTLIQHGFSPSSEDQYYETPFGTTDLDKRGWQWCENDSDDVCVFMPDMSYVVEPQKDIWLLAIDANVYEPVGKLSDRKFKGSGNAGYNALMVYKPELIKWIKSVVERARRKGKRLVSFSHFPMADFYDDTKNELVTLFGETSMQLKRMPTPETTAALAQTGLRLHMAGHMHLYDTHTPGSATGLVNVQVPSLAAWVPGYSLVTLNSDNSADVDTVIQSSVPGFNSLFPIYRKEREQLRISTDSAWWPDILEADDYLMFTDAHLRGVVHHRFVGKEWPKPLAKYISEHSIADVITLLFGEVSIDIADKKTLEMPAMTLAYDYYRIRNAGRFVDLKGREALYERLGTRLENTTNSMSGMQLQIKQLLKLLAIANQRQDPTHIHVTGV